MAGELLTNRARDAATSERVSAQKETDSYRRTAEWDVRWGFRNYLSLIGTQACGTLLAFTALWLATHVLGPAGYGQVVAILAASQLVGRLTVYWSGVSVTRFGCQEFVEHGQIAGAFWNRLLILTPNLLIAIATSAWWLPPISSWLHLPTGTTAVVLGSFVTSALSGHVQQALTAAKLPRLNGGVLAIERGVTLLLLCALVGMGRMSITTAACAYAVAPLATCAVGCWRMRQLILPVAPIDRRLLTQMLSFSLPLIPYSVTGYLTTNYLDALFISHYLPGADLARYTVAYQVVGTAMQLPTLAGTLLLSFFVTLLTNGRTEWIISYLRDVLPFLTFVYATGCALIAAVAAGLISCVFGPHFQALGPLLWPLAAAAALGGPAFMGYYPLNTARSATHVTAFGGIAAACANLLLDIMLIPKWGLVGSAWATVVAYGIGTLVAAFFVNRDLPSARGWSLQATCPILIGAAIMVQPAHVAPAVAATFVATGLLACVRWKSILTGAAMLRTACSSVALQANR